MIMGRMLIIGRGALLLVFAVLAGDVLCLEWANAQQPENPLKVTRAKIQGNLEPARPPDIPAPDLPLLDANALFFKDGAGGPKGGPAPVAAAPFLRGKRYKPYELHGEDWTVASCGLRHRQSPINFEETLEATPTLTLPFDYHAMQSPLPLQPDGSVALEGFDLGGVVHQNNYYPLTHISMHAMSEHTWFGNHTPIEMQLMHKKPDSDAYVGVSIRISQWPKMFQPPPVGTRINATSQDELMKDLREFGPRFKGYNRPLQHFVDPNKTNIYNALDLNDWLNGAAFWKYEGSLTEPPCSEVVTWYVRRDPIPALPGQINLLYDKVLRVWNVWGNSRVAMPRQERAILVASAVRESNIEGRKAPDIKDYYPSGGDPQALVGPNPRQDRTDMIESKAKKSLDSAIDSLRRAKEADYKIRMASYRHAEVLAPDLMKYVPLPEKPKFDTYSYEPKPFEIDPMDTAQKMAKAVGHIAQGALENAASRIVHLASKATADAANLAVTGGTTAGPTQQAFLFNVFSTTTARPTETFNPGIGPGGPDHWNPMFNTF